MERDVVRNVTFLGAMLLVSACGNPLSKVERLSSVELAESAPVAEVAATEEKNPSGGFLSRILGRSKEPAVALEEAGVVEEAASAGSADVPEAAEMQEQSEADVDQTEGAVAKPAKRRGLFGLFARKDKFAVVEQATDGDVAEVEDAAVETAVEPEAEKVAAVTGGAEAAEPKTRRGLFGLLSGARAKSRDMTPSGEQVRTASLGPVDAPEIADEKAQKKGLFAKTARPHKGPDQQIVAFGTALPSGVVARVCEFPKGRLGAQVGKFPERGRGYTIFDSNSKSEVVRPFYVSGFQDGCLRTFTASMALFGSPTMHEQLRYGLPSSVQPYSTTDKAYEGIKSAICKVGRKKACGSKIGLLEKDTAFISVYDRFGSNAKWSNILLHRGWVLAADHKG